MKKRGRWERRGRAGGIRRQKERVGKREGEERSERGSSEEEVGS